MPCCVTVCCTELVISCRSVSACRGVWVQSWVRGNIVGITLQPSRSRVRWPARIALLRRDRFGGRRGLCSRQFFLTRAYQRFCATFRDKCSAARTVSCRARDRLLEAAPANLTAVWHQAGTDVPTLFGRNFFLFLSYPGLFGLTAGAGLTTPSVKCVTHRPTNIWHRWSWSAQTTATLGKSQDACPRREVLRGSQ